MKYNVIFENISEETFDPPAAENTEDVLRKFIRDELHITDEIHFQNVHRLKVCRDRKLRGIIARFVYFKDKETVLKAAAGGSNVSSEMFSKIRYFIDQVCCELTIRLLLPRVPKFYDENHAYLDRLTHQLRKTRRTSYVNSYETNYTSRMKYIFRMYIG
jgi:hypothetical protein